MLQVRVNSIGLFSVMDFGTCPALGFDWDFIRSVIHRQGTLESLGKRLFPSPFLPSTFQNGPELLPRRDMLVLLTQVIGTGSPRLQVSAQLHNHSQDSP